jgi:proliferating cell nuclear antigen
MVAEFKTEEVENGGGEVAAIAAPPRNNRRRRMEFMTVQSSAVRTVIESLRDLLTDTVIEFDDKGMKIMTTDTSRTVLVHLWFDGSKCEKYFCDQKLSIGVSMNEFHKILRSITNNDTLTLFVDCDDLNHLGIKIENFEKNARSQYSLRLLDLGHDKLEADPMRFDSVITLPATDFQKICRDMHQLGVEVMEIKDVQNQLIFSCEGDFCTRETVLCDKNNDMYSQGSKKNAHDIVQGVFSIKFLLTFIKCTNLCNTVDLMLKNDFPLVVRYGVASLGEIKFCLAEQVQDDPKEGLSTFDMHE